MTDSVQALAYKGTGDGGMRADDKSQEQGAGQPAPLTSQLCGVAGCINPTEGSEVICGMHCDALAAILAAHFNSSRP